MSLKFGGKYQNNLANHARFAGLQVTFFLLGLIKPFGIITHTAVKKLILTTEPLCLNFP